MIYLNTIMLSKYIILTWNNFHIIKIKCKNFILNTEALTFFHFLCVDEV
jgi:hypothetical protein